MAAILCPMNSKTPQPKKLPGHIGIAACSFELDGVATDVRVVPAGNFRSRDGRPTECPNWSLTEAGAQAILASRNQTKDKFLFDYNHQTLYVQQTGQKAMAAGWAEALEWRPGDGLYATGTEWTPTAQQEIANKDFRYISPVITYDKQTGEVTGLLMASLVNYAALDNLFDLAAMSAFLPLPDETQPMEELQEKLRYCLNLPVSTTASELSAELDKIKGLIAAPDGTTAGLAAILQQRDNQIAALSAQAPDPAKFVPVSAVQELQSQFAALSAKVAESEIDTLIKNNLTKLPTPGLQAWAKTQTLAALSAYLDKAPEVAALAGMQSGGNAPVKAPVTEDAAKTEWQNSAALQAEFSDVGDYIAFQKASANGLVKIKGDNS